MSLVDSAPPSKSSGYAYGSFW